MGRKNRNRAQPEAEQPTEATEAVEQPTEATEAVEQPTEATEAVEQPTEATEAVEQPVEATEAVAPKAKSKLAAWLAGAKVAHLTRDDSLTFDTATTMRLLVQANPKRGTGLSRQCFDLYRDGMSLANYIVAVQKIVPGRPGEVRARADFAWDFNHGFIELLAPVAPAEAEQPEMANA